MADLLNSVLSAVPWPLPVRPSSEGLADPETRRLVATALTELGAAALLLTGAITLRRFRTVAVLVAIPLVITQVPSLLLLLIPATPTSYRPSPTGFTAASIASGRTVFAGSCVACHGNSGNGENGLGPVADLRQPHIWTHPVGDLFWFVSHGINDQDGTARMPAFETVLSQQARWFAIDYVQALNAGAVVRGLDGWPQRMPAPLIPLACPSTAVRSLADLRGKAVRIILGQPPLPLTALPPVNGIDVITIWIPGTATEAAAVPGIDCIVQHDAEAATAYAILAGSADGRLISARFLIDPEGVLRSVWRQDDGRDWADPNRLLEEIRTICTEPLTIGTGDEHEHHH